MKGNQENGTWTIDYQQTNKNHSKELNSKSQVEKYKTEIKHALEEFKSTFAQEENQISTLEDETNELSLRSRKKKE